MKKIDISVHINNLRECQLSNGVVSKKLLEDQYPQTLSFLSHFASSEKNKGNNISMWDVARSLCPEIKIKKIMSLEEHQQILQNCQAKYGYVDFQSLNNESPETYNFYCKYAKRFSLKNGTNLNTWKLIQTLYPELVIERKLKESDHIDNLYKCMQLYGYIDKKSLCEICPKTYNAMSKISTKLQKKGINIALWDVVKMLCPEAVVEQKVSKEKHVQNLLECQNEFGEVSIKSLKSKWPETFYYLSRCAAWENQTNGTEITMWDVARSLVPNLVVGERKRLNVENAIQLLGEYADENGHVDAFRNDSYLYGIILRAAKAEGKHYTEWIEEKSEKLLGKKLTVSSYIYDNIDVIQILYNKLISYYGEGGDISGISIDHPYEYRQLLKLKNQFPNGAKKSVADTAVALGFKFGNGMNRESKVSNKYVDELLAKYYPDRGIKSLYKNPKAIYALVVLAGREGKTIDQILESKGYSYKREKLGKNKAYLSSMRVSKDVLKELEEIIEKDNGNADEK